MIYNSNQSKIKNQIKNFAKCTTLKRQVIIMVFSRPLWTGKQIYSLIIPEINYIKKDAKDEANFHKNDDSVIIKRGELLTGTMKKAIVGNAKGS